MTRKIRSAVWALALLLCAAFGSAAQAQTVNGMFFNPFPAIGGQSDTVSLTLDSPAPAGGLLVGLSSSSSVVTVPKNITIAAGASQGSFTAATSKVASVTNVSIVATTSVGGSFQWQSTLTVDPAGYVVPRVNGMFFRTDPVAGGTSDTVLLTLSAPAPVGGMAISLTSPNSSVVLPASVEIDTGQTEVAFEASTKAVANPTSVRLEASTSYQGTWDWFNTLEVVPVGYIVPRVTAISFSPYPATAGGNCTVTLGLSTAAPTGGLPIAITTNNTAAIAVPATVTASTGAKNVSFVANCSSAVKTVTNVTITATTSVAGTWQSFNTLEIDPVGYVIPRVNGITFNPTVVIGGNNDIATLRLTTAAPAGGLAVTLASNSAALTVHTATVTVPAGATTLNVTLGTTAVSKNTAAGLTATTHVSGTWSWMSSFNIVP